MTDILSESIRSFPFPFFSSSYHYSANVQPAGREELTEVGAWGREIFRVDDSYERERARRQDVLRRDPGRSQTLPHMLPAEWDALVFVCATLADDHPESFSFLRDGDECVFESRRSQEILRFTVGEGSTLEGSPLEVAAAQVGEDLILLDEREERLWADAGILTSGSIWSIAFNAGMSFAEIHGPVPGAGPGGPFDRAERFLLRLGPGEVYRRLNWGLQTNDQADLSMESFETWLPTRQHVADAGAAEAAEAIHLRVEVQHVIRLPASGAILFAIDIRLLSIADVARVPVWVDRTIGVLSTLSRDIREYKGIEGIDDAVVSYLRSHA